MSSSPTSYRIQHPIEDGVTSVQIREMLGVTMAPMGPNSVAAVTLKEAIDLFKVQSRYLKHTTLLQGLSVNMNYTDKNNFDALVLKEESKMAEIDIFLPKEFIISFGQEALRHKFVKKNGTLTVTNHLDKKIIEVSGSMVGSRFLKNAESFANVSSELRQQILGWAARNEASRMVMVEEFPAIIGNATHFMQGYRQFGTHMKLMHVSKGFQNDLLASGTVRNVFQNLGKVFVYFNTYQDTLNFVSFAPLGASRLQFENNSIARDLKTVTLDINMVTSSANRGVIKSVGTMKSLEQLNITGNIIATSPLATTLLPLRYSYHKISAVVNNDGNDSDRENETPVDMIEIRWTDLSGQVHRGSEEVLNAIEDEIFILNFQGMQQQRVNNMIQKLTILTSLVNAFALKMVSTISEVKVNIEI